MEAGLTTEYRGLNRRIHGGIQALVEQSKEAITFKKMKHRIKIIAALENGFPTEEKYIKLKKADGSVKMLKYLEVGSLAGESTANGMIVMQTMQEIADFYELYLYEYDEKEVPYRSVGGRNKELMGVFIEEIRAAGDEGRARLLEEVPGWNGKRWVFKGQKANDDKPDIF
jgi:hypothetical protein